MQAAFTSKNFPQMLAVLAAAKPVGPKRNQPAGKPGAIWPATAFNVIAGGDDGALGVG